MPKFIIQNLKSQEEQEYSLHQDNIVFGRINTCDIELPVKSVSRRHAEIVREAQDYFLSDLKSGNGTFLNNQKIRPMEKNLLRSGDLIRIEDYEIRFILAEDNAEHPIEEDTDTDILEIKLIKKMLKTLDTDETPNIEVLNGVAAGKKLLIPDTKQEVVIGRDSNADLIIDENVISRLHVKMERKWGGIVIVDLQSKNGTFVNNDRVEEKLLRDGDKIMLGTVKLLYRNPKDVNLDVISQEISKKKKEAAMREAERLAQKQAEEERIERERVEKEEARKEAEEKAVQEALEKERAEEEIQNAVEASPPPSPEAPPAPPSAPTQSSATPAKPGFSTAEKLMIVGGILVGIAAIAGLVLLLLK
ncbi:MAG: FHA domain-containing protein [Deltaproteobacteria bacterium]|nr:FHA domain-containing protein [Deltaproteobacteria bacterium]